MRERGKRRGERQVGWNQRRGRNGVAGRVRGCQMRGVEGMGWKVWGGR